MSSSASDPGKGITPSLAGRIEALERQTAGLTAALAHAQRVRLLITLALVAFVGLTITLFYRRANELRTPEYIERLRQAVQSKLEPRQDQLLKEATILYQTAGPKFTDAFYSQAKKDLPIYLQAAERERDEMVKNLQEKLQTKLAERFEKSVARQEELLKQEFPMADNPGIHERMMQNVEQGLQQVAKKYYGDKLQEEMLLLYGRWDQFPAADPPSDGQAPIEDQLIGTLLELLTLKLKATELAATE